MIAVKCCKILVSKIDKFVLEVHRASVLDQTASGLNLNLKGKAKVVFAGASMEDVLRMMDRQTSSMILLLTACNW